MVQKSRTGFLIGVTAGVFLTVGTLVGLIISANFGPQSTLQTGVRPADSGPAQPPSGVPLPPVNGGFVDIAKATTPAVVNISTSWESKGEGGGPTVPFFDDPFFRRFFGDEFFRQFENPRQRRQQSLGSGVIVDPGGLIITNNHVVEKADRIKVLLSDQREFDAEVIGTDPKTDLAVIKIEDGDLPTIPWGDSDSLQVGEYVLAIGNPFGLNQTVTMGIVSAVGRANVGIAEYEDFIQTDAAINPGNSGGALVNTRGELVGINTAIFSQSGGYMGVGFAVPSAMARLIMDSLIREGKVVRGWLGVSIQDITPELSRQFRLSDNRGALISEVMEGSPASRAGLKQGDVIISYAGQKIDSTIDLRNRVAQTRVGENVNVRVIRDEKEVELKVDIGEQPKDVSQLGSIPGHRGEEKLSSALEGVVVGELTSDATRRFGLPEFEEGVIILEISPGSRAEEAGLKRGDLVVEINRTPLKSLSDYNRAVEKIQKNQPVLILVNREGRQFYLSLKP
ncbi:MAG TPA: DegQ family serine endoprotease [Nitrospiria bacterium]